MKNGVLIFSGSEDGTTVASVAFCPVFGVRLYAFYVLRP